MNNVIMKYEDINNLFKNTYKIYNFTMRINEIEKNMIAELKRKSVNIIENLENERSLKIRNLQGNER